MNTPIPPPLPPHSPPPWQPDDRITLVAKRVGATILCIVVYLAAVNYTDDVMQIPNTLLFLAWKWWPLVLIVSLWQIVAALNKRNVTPPAPPRHP